MKRLTKYSNKVSYGDFSISYSEIIDELELPAVLDYFANNTPDQSFLLALKQYIEKNYEGGIDAFVELKE